MIPFQFCRDFRHQKTRLAGLSYGVVCVILRLADSVEHLLVTDGQTDRRRQLIPALASVARATKRQELKLEFTFTDRTDFVRQIVVT